MSVFPKTAEAYPGVDSREYQLIKVGRHLKTIRTRQGLSLQQVAKRTHIQPQQLRAIETGSWMQLPEAIYVRGFLQRYAQSLGLDGRVIAERISVKPVAVNPKWLNSSDFSTRQQGLWSSLTNWWAKLTPLV